MADLSPESLKKENTYTQAVKDRIAELLRFSPTMPSAQAAPQMGGMAGQAQQAIQNRPYQLYVQEMQAQGLQPVSPQEFMLMQQGQ